MGKSGKNAKDKRAGGKGQSSRFYVLNGKKIAGGQGIGNKSTNTGSAGSNLSNIKIRTGSSGFDRGLTQNTDAVLKNVGQGDLLNSKIGSDVGSGMISTTIHSPT